jgi:hypothetical protein
MNAPLRQRLPRYENRKLLNTARGMPCYATFSHDCKEHLGCVPAHANWLLFGKGHGLKVSDCFFASVCPPAHDIIDRRIPSDMSEEVLQQEWLRAYISTQDHLWRQGLVKVSS